MCWFSYYTVMFDTKKLCILIPLESANTLHMIVVLAESASGNQGDNTDYHRMQCTQQYCRWVQCLQRRLVYYHHYLDCVVAQRRMQYCCGWLQYLKWNRRRTSGKLNNQKVVKLNDRLLLPDFLQVQVGPLYSLHMHSAQEPNLRTPERTPQE